MKLINGLRFWAFSVFFSSTLFGCAFFLPQSNDLIETPPKDIKRYINLTDVPFYAQTDYQCGPSSLAMVLNYLGLSVSIESLVDQIYIPSRKGSLQVEMMAATRGHGLVAYKLAPKLTDILKEVASGTPVIVLENYSFGIYDVWHYSVVIGFDLNEGRIIRRSGKNKIESMPFAAFEYLWKKDKYWSMVAMQPNRIPASANEDSYVAAVLDLEKVGQLQSARIAYEAATTRWPKNLKGRMGLGNTAYALSDLAGAEVAFKQATVDYPESVAAYNNFAHVSAELGNYETAHNAAKYAVSLGGPLIDISKSTLIEIQKKILSNP